MKGNSFVKKIVECNNEKEEEVMRGKNCVLIYCCIKKESYSYYKTPVPYFIAASHCAANGGFVG